MQQPRSHQESNYILPECDWTLFITGVKSWYGMMVLPNHFLIPYDEHSTPSIIFLDLTANSLFLNWKMRTKSFYTHSQAYMHLSTQNWLPKLIFKNSVERKINAANAEIQSLLMTFILKQHYTLLILRNMLLETDLQAVQVLSWENV